VARAWPGQAFRRLIVPMRRGKHGATHRPDRPRDAASPASRVRPPPVWRRRNPRFGGRSRFWPNSREAGLA
jgi:hypothetical protein